MRRSVLFTVKGKVDVVMADDMEMGLEVDSERLVPGNRVKLNGVCFLIHRRDPPRPNPGKNRVYLYMARDRRTRQQRRLMEDGR